MKHSLALGVLAAAAAAASWSLAYVVPFFIGDYSLFDFALLEFLLSGALSLGLMWRRADAVRRLEPRDWAMAFALGAIGYAGYFLTVMGAASYAGPVIAPAFLGLVPVVLAIAGNVRERTVSWRALMVPLAFATVGLLLVNGGDFARAEAPQMPSMLLGIALAGSAVALWTLFGVLNQSALLGRPQMEADVWTALILVGAGLAMLIFLPVGLWAGVFEFPRLGLRWNVAAPLFIWAGALAVFANVGGAMAWTFASQRLPVVLAAQLITMEPVAATVLGLLVHHRLPTVSEVLGMAVLLIGVLVAVSLFARPAPAGGLQASTLN